MEGNSADFILHQESVQRQRDKQTSQKLSTEQPPLDHLICHSLPVVHVWGDVWRKDEQTCFPSKCLPPMLEYGLNLGQGLEVDIFWSASSERGGRGGGGVGGGGGGGSGGGGWSSPSSSVNDFSQ